MADEIGFLLLLESHSLQRKKKKKEREKKREGGANSGAFDYGANHASARKLARNRTCPMFVYSGQAKDMDRQISHCGETRMR